jgi:hypothetical protein
VNQLHPSGDDRYRITLTEFRDAYRHQPELLEAILFSESQTDIAVYHGVPLYGFFKDGSSPIRFGLEMARRLPHRAYVYADTSPWQDDALRHLEQALEQPGVIGVKFYPIDLVDGEIRPVDFRRREALYPLVELARARGIRTIAIHKAVPLGPVPRALYHTEDLPALVQDFPDMTFEIVHGGFAFAEETAALLASHENVTINLETNPCFIVNHMMEPLLRTGAWRRIFFATGASAVHPRPFIEAFWAYRAPDGFTELSPEMKRGILGENFARHHGWDVEALKTACRNDRYGLEGKQLERPWSLFREQAS